MDLASRRKGLARDTVFRDVKAQIIARAVREEAIHSPIQYLSSPSLELSTCWVQQGADFHFICACLRCVECLVWTRRLTGNNDGGRPSPQQALQTQFASRRPST